MCQGEDDTPKPDAGTSQYGGGAPPPPSPPQPQAPVSAPTSTTAEEGVTEVELRTKKSDYENYDGYILSLDDILDYFHLSQYRLDENHDNFSNSSGQGLGDKKSQYWSDENHDNISNSSGQGLGDKKLLEDLFGDFKYDIFRQKITLLFQKYKFFRRTARDGNCFYRAFIFSYLEHVSEIQDGSERINEVSNLRRCVENTKQAYESFGSFPIDEAKFLTACDALEFVIALIESGLSSDELYSVDCKEGIISEILPFLRFLVKVELCTREDFYSPFVSSEGYESVHEYCKYQVIRDDTEANHYQITALVNALGVPLIVENFDTSSNNGVVQLNQNAFCPRLDVEVSQMKAFELQSIEICSTSSKGDAGERTITDLSLAERRRLVTLLFRPGHYDILYPK